MRPADGDTAAEQRVSTEALPLNRAMIAGGIRCQLFDAVACIRAEPPEGNAGVLVGIDSLGGVDQQQRFAPVDIHQSAVRSGIG